MFLIVVCLCEGVCGISVGAFIVVEHGGQDGRARYLSEHGGQEAPQLEGRSSTDIFICERTEQQRARWISPRLIINPVNICHSLAVS